MLNIYRCAMEILCRPWRRPRNPKFSSGPCAKRPGYSLKNLDETLLGRSHRAEPCKKAIQDVCDLSRDILGLPDDFLIGVMPGSDTGAFEAALWNMLGERPVDVCAWEAFGKKWLVDVRDELALPGVTFYEPRYGYLPDLRDVNFDHDVVFTENGTTSGVRTPQREWISKDRAGLTFCDATSAVFAIPMQPWDRYDAVTFSWQKSMGGEAGCGILILSPRAVNRLNAFKPENRPMPVVLKAKSGGQINMEIFRASPINTISMLSVADALDSLQWMKSIGGLKATQARTQKNFQTLSLWVDRTPWIDFLAEDPAVRSPTSVCLKLNNECFPGWNEEKKAAFCKELKALAEKHKAGFDFNAYKTAPAGLRIWCGPTVEARDIALLTKWIDWAYLKCRKDYDLPFRPGPAQDWQARLAQRHYV